MARLAGVDLPRNKRMEVALTYIYGIGPARAAQLLKETGISPDLRTDNLTDEQLSSLRDVIEATWKVEGDLRFRLIFVARLRSAATRACVTVVACLFVASAPRPTLVRVRVRRRRSQERRSK